MILIFRLALIVSLLPCSLMAADPMAQAHNAVQSMLKCHASEQGIDLGKPLQDVLTNPSTLQQLATASYADESFELTAADITVNFTWGFGNSGDCLVPLPPIKVTLKTGALDFSAPSVQGLAAFVVKKNIIANTEQQVGFLRFCENIGKNPLSLFGLKVALLVKDHKKTDPRFVQEELSRLVLRLALSQLPESIKKAKSLSAILPVELHGILKTYAPEALEIMDACWLAIVDPAACQVMIASNELLSPKDTAKAFAATLLGGARQLVTARQEYFAQNPSSIKAAQEKSRASNAQDKLARQYLATPEGKRTATILQDDINRLEARRSALAKADTVSSSMDLSADLTILQTLRTQAKEYSVLGQAVPEDLRTAIVSLEQKITTATKTANRKPLSAYSSIAEELALLHDATANKLEAEASLQEHKKAHDNDFKLLIAKAAKTTDKYLPVADDEYLLVAEQHKTRLALRPVLAYVSLLKQQAQLLRERAGKINELARLRYLYQIGVLDQDDELAQLGILEADTGYLLNAQSLAEFFPAVLSKPSSVQSIKHEICYNDTLYKNVRAQLIDQLAMIIKRSPHLQENIDVYRYMIALMMPELLPVFDRLVAIQKAVV
jgi:hypothetical protein